MNSINAGSEHNVQAVIHQNAGLCSLRQIAESTNKVEEFERGKILFADLNEIHTILNRAPGRDNDVALPAVRHIAADHFFMAAPYRACIRIRSFGSAIKNAEGFPEDVKLGEAQDAVHETET